MNLQGNYWVPWAMAGIIAVVLVLVSLQTRRKIKENSRIIKKRYSGTVVCPLLSRQVNI